MEFPGIRTLAEVSPPRSIFSRLLKSRSPLVFPLPWLWQEKHLLSRILWTWRENNFSPFLLSEEEANIECGSRMKKRIFFINHIIFASRQIRVFSKSFSSIALTILVCSFSISSYLDKREYFIIIRTLKPSQVLSKWGEA